MQSVSTDHTQLQTSIAGYLANLQGSQGQIATSLSQERIDLAQNDVQVTGAVQQTLAGAVSAYADGHGQALTQLGGASSQYATSLAALGTQFSTAQGAAQT